MSTVGFFTPFKKVVDTKFVVRNIAPDRRRLRVFGAPIPYNMTRDLMAIEAVSEADIRHSLLKGELASSFRAGELVVVESNIDLLQFDNTQKTFLQSIGIVDGLEVTGTGSALTFALKQNVALVGAINDVNTVYTIPPPDKFINGSFSANEFRISVMHNGRILVQGIDFTISESGGVGAGFDTITIVSFIPATGSTMLADYVVEI